jgi:PAS domain S-box-containing protein
MVREREKPSRREEGANEGPARQVTAHERAEEEVRRLVCQNELILNAAGEGIYGLDLEGRTTFCNPAAAAMVGWEAQELIGKPQHAVLHHTTPDGSPYPREECPIYAAFKDGAVHHVANEVFWRKDGTSFPVEYVSTPIREGDALVGAVVVFRDITDRKRMEEALLASQQMCQMVLDTIPARVFWKDRESTYLGCNLRFAEDAGLASPEEIIGKNDLQLPWSEHTDLYRGDDREVIRSGIPKLNYEEPLTRPAGARRWLRTSKVPLRDRDGTIMGVLGCFEDITERKQAEDALTESEARLRAITSALPDLVFLLDRDGRFVEFLTVQEMYRYVQPEAVKGKLARDVLPSDVADRFVAAATRTLATGQPQTLEYSFSTRGEHRWFEARTAPMELPASRRPVVAVVSRDITDRKLAETLSMRLGRIIERSVIDSRTFRFVQVNQGARENLGYSLEELRDLTPLELKPEFTRETFEALIKPLRDGTREQLVFETFHRRKDGSAYQVEVRLQLMRTETPPVLVAIIQDITDRKAVEEQLRQAQKMEAVGQLTGGIAHDFNNLLTIILGNLDLLGERLERLGGNKDLGRLVALATEAADRGNVLTQRLLAFSRKQLLQPRLVDVNALVAGMLDLLGRPLGEEVEVEFVGAGGLWACEADPGQLENSLLNLVINSRDAMPRGGKITIETGNADVDEASAASHGDAAPGQYAMLSVTDNGTGMPPEVLEHVFEPFYTTKELDKGTGLGLSMVYGFVKQSGGFVSISSREGQGTTVRIYLPRAHAAAVHEPARATAGQQLWARGEVAVPAANDRNP